MRVANRATFREAGKLAGASRNSASRSAGSVPRSPGIADTDTQAPDVRPSAPSAICAMGSDRIDSAGGGALPDLNWTDVRVDGAIGEETFLEGLAATFRRARLLQHRSPRTRSCAYLNHAVRY